MPYTATTWTNGTTALNSTHLTNLETQYTEATNSLEQDLFTAFVFSGLVATKDGRTLSGFLADKDKQVVVLRGLDGANQVLPQDQILEMKTTGVSLMPQGLLASLTDQQLRDLFAYLQSAQPLVGDPPQR